MHVYLYPCSRARPTPLSRATDNFSRMEREEAIDLLKRYVTSQSHIVHGHATAAIMRKVAEHLGEDADMWEIIGLLHDIDYDLVDGEMERHGIEGYQILIENGVPRDIAEIVRRHNHMLTSGYERPIEVALQAADSASAHHRLRPCKRRAIDDVTPRTVRRSSKRSLLPPVASANGS